MKRPLLALLFPLLACSACEPFLADNGERSGSTQQKQLQLAEHHARGQIMQEDRFWQLIQASSTEAREARLDPEIALRNTLTSLEPEEIVRFDNTFGALMEGAYDWKLWGASYVINGGCSDDCFRSFRLYLIYQGKDRFYSTLNDPESCSSWIRREEVPAAAGIQYAAAAAYQLKTGNELPVTFATDQELKGEPFDENTVGLLYPKLAQRFGTPPKVEAAPESVL